MSKYLIKYFNYIENIINIILFEINVIKIKIENI